jgi:hypothetical protein
VEEYSQKDIGWRLRHALKKLRLCDDYLLEKDCNERSITHRLGMYLQQEFDGWDVDCEYNRDVNSSDLIKRLQLNSETVAVDDTNARTVFPDIIVHHRGTGDNLLVIEVKKSTNREDQERDKEKLRAFKKQFGYCHAVFLCLHTGEAFQVEPISERIEDCI